MKSVLFATHKARPQSFDAKPVDGMTFRVVPSPAPHLPPAEIAAKLAAFYEKYPRRTLRKGQKTIVEQLRDDRDRR